MTLDKLIADLIKIREENPATGTMDVLLERTVGGPCHIAYISGMTAAGDGPEDLNSPDTASITLALLDF
jgi:hypothetical protein